MQMKSTSLPKKNMPMKCTSLPMQWSAKKTKCECNALHCIGNEVPKKICQLNALHCQCNEVPKKMQMQGTSLHWQ